MRTPPLHDTLKRLARPLASAPVTLESLDEQGWERALKEARVLFASLACPLSAQLDSARAEALFEQALPSPLPSPLVELLSGIAYLNLHGCPQEHLSAWLSERLMERAAKRGAWRSLCAQLALSFPLEALISSAQEPPKELPKGLSEGLLLLGALPFELAPKTLGELSACSSALINGEPVLWEASEQAGGYSELLSALELLRAGEAQQALALLQPLSVEGEALTTLKARLCAALSGEPTSSASLSVSSEQGLTQDERDERDEREERAQGEPPKPLNVEALMRAQCGEEALRLARPLPREQLGPWSVEHKLSRLASCETWRARRRLGSLYKEGALQWRALTKSLSAQQTKEAPIKGVSAPLSEPLNASLKRYQALNSPHLLSLLDWGWDPSRGLAYLVEERAPGPSLLEAHQQRPLSPPQALGVVRALLTGLKSLHEAGLSHGHIKQEGVIWRGQGWALCTPTSLLSRLPGGATPSARARAVWLSAPERVEGWREVEQMAEGAELPDVTPAHDLYALGRLLQELLGEAGVSAFEGEAREVVEELLWGLCHPSPPMRGSAGAWLSSWGQAGERWLIKGSEERYSLPQLLAKLEGDVLSSWALEVSPVSLASPLWRPWWEHATLAAQVAPTLLKTPLTSEALSTPHSAHLALSALTLPLKRPALPNGAPPRQLELTLRLIPQGESYVEASAVSAQPMWVSEGVITRGQWLSLMPTHEGLAHRDEQPVDSLPLLEAARFCNTLSERLGLERAYLIEEREEETPRVTLISSAMGARLPTEEEWVYLSLAAQRGQYAGEHEPHEGVLGLSRSGAQLSEVKQGPPNAWGLYDTCGLVWEWTSPHEGELIRPNDSATICGGGWLNEDESCRSTHRKRREAGERSVEQGFRVVIPSALA